MTHLRPVFQHPVEGRKYLVAFLLPAFDLCDLLTNPCDHLSIGAQVFVLVAEDFPELGDRAAYALELLDESKAFDGFLGVVAVVVGVPADMPAVQEAFLLIEADGVGRQAGLSSQLLNRHIPPEISCLRVYSKVYLLPGSFEHAVLQEDFSMVVFVTGATGFIGSAVVKELLGAGHKVIGLSRSEQGARALKEVGAEVRRGDLDDLEALRSGAAAADGIIHLAFRHDAITFDFAAALKTDLLAIQAMGAAIEGSGKPFLMTNHMNGELSEKAALGLKGVRAIAVSLSPSVHGQGDKHGFVPRLIATARTKGFSAWVGDGTNRWPAVHRLDAANLYRLALEKAPSGSRLSGRGDEGVPFREIAGAIGRMLGLPARSIPREEAEAHFGFLGRIAATDIPAAHGSSEETRKLLDWRPVHPGLIADIEEGHYFGN